jgi:hypothetical protein
MDNFHEDALATLRTEHPDYNIGYADGRWLARYRADLLAPLIEADLASVLTTLLSADEAKRRAGSE